MTTAVEDISRTKKRLKLEIPAEVIDREYKEALGKLKQQVKIPGFRPGKAPENLIEKKYGEDIKADMLDRLVPRYYSQALKDASLVPVTLPSFEGSLLLKKGAPLSFSLTVEVRPDIDGLNYAGLKTEVIAARVEEAEVEETLNGLREERAMYDAVDREIRSDDLIVIDYVKRDPSGEKELSSAKDQVMNLGNNLAPQGILDELLGKKKGDSATIRLPNNVGEEESLTANGGDLLEITIKEVKEKHLPALDDEFAKDLGMETLTELTEKVREGILKAKKDKAANEQKGKLLTQLISAQDFEVPESLLEKELETLVVNEKLSKKQGPEAMAGEADSSPPEGDGKLREELMPKAVERVKAHLILDVIAEKEGISATEDELKARIAALARQFQTTPDNIINLFVTKDGSLDNLMRTIRDEKVMDAVLAKAEIIQGAQTT